MPIIYTVITPFDAVKFWVLISLKINFLVENPGRNLPCRGKYRGMAGSDHPYYTAGDFIIPYEWDIIAQLSGGIAFWLVNLYINLLN